MYVKGCAAKLLATLSVLFSPYRGLLYCAQNIVKKDPGRAWQNSLATAGTNFTKPGAQNKGDLCIFMLIELFEHDC